MNVYTETDILCLLSSLPYLDSQEKMIQRGAGKGNSQSMHKRWEGRGTGEI